MALNLKKLAQTATATAFNLAAQLVVTLEYRQVQVAGYDPATSTAAPTVTTATVNALMFGLSQDEKNNEATREAQCKLIVKSAELGAIIPSRADKLEQQSETPGSILTTQEAIALATEDAEDIITETGLNTIWEVVAIDRDPTGTFYTLLVKRSAI